MSKKSDELSTIDGPKQPIHSLVEGVVWSCMELYGMRCKELYGVVWHARGIDSGGIVARERRLIVDTRYQVGSDSSCFWSLCVALVIKLIESQMGW